MLLGRQCGSPEGALAVSSCSPGICWATLGKSVNFGKGLSNFIFHKMDFDLFGIFQKVLVGPEFLGILIGIEKKQFCSQVFLENSGLIDFFRAFSPEDHLIEPGIPLNILYKLLNETFQPLLVLTLP